MDIKPGDQVRVKRNGRSSLMIYTVDQIGDEGMASLLYPSGNKVCNGITFDMDAFVKVDNNVQD